MKYEIIHQASNGRGTPTQNCGPITRLLTLCIIRLSRQQDCTSITLYEGGVRTYLARSILEERFNFSAQFDNTSTFTEIYISSASLETIKSFTRTADAALPKFARQETAT